MPPRISLSSGALRNIGKECMRKFSSSSAALKEFNTPPTNKTMMRAGGIASMFRLPVEQTSEGLDACFVGIPLDIGVTNRPGSRFGPRHIRVESVMCRLFTNDTEAKPFESLMVADLGDINFCQFDIVRACNEIRDAMSKIIQDGCIPLSLGGDHTVTYPILQAMKEKYGPVGLIHVDAHTDVYGDYLGHRVHHGNTFLLANEEGCLDPTRTIQIGLRGSGMGSKCGTDYDKSRSLGFRAVPAKDCWWKSMTPLMEEVKEMMGDRPVYISFDIDSLDPCYAPGTGTPEIAGLTTIQALEIIRGCRGLNIVGCDLVEVSPQYDTTGRTAYTAANILFEMLAVLPGVKYGLP